MSEIGLDELGYTERLYILAFDHRGSFEKIVGAVARVPGAQTRRWAGAQDAAAPTTTATTPTRTITTADRDQSSALGGLRHGPGVAGGTRPAR